MLRGLVILLMLANAAFWAWTQGWLSGVVGVRPTGDREPERLARQVRPEHIKVLPPPSVDTSTKASAGASPSSGGASAAALGPASAVWALPDCHELGPFSLAELPAAITALRAAWPTARWEERREDKAAIWAVYIGPFQDSAELLQKQKALRRQGYTVGEPPAGRADLAGGLLLGHFADINQAASALTKWQKQGGSDARVLEIEEASSRIFLRTELFDAALAARLAALPVLTSSSGQTLLTVCGVAR